MQNQILFLLPLTKFSSAPLKVYPKIYTLYFFNNFFSCKVKLQHTHLQSSLNLRHAQTNFFNIQHVHIIVIFVFYSMLTMHLFRKVLKIHNAKEKHKNNQQIMFLKLHVRDQTFNNEERVHPFNFYFLRSLSFSLIGFVTIVTLLINYLLNYQS